MIVEIKEYEKKYFFNLKPITQLCGHNIQTKTYILESLRKYFSTYKYRDGQNRWRDNTFIDGENVGRKFFDVISIGNRLDILTLIKWSKQSLITEYVKQLMQKFDWQSHLRAIDEELEIMTQMLNEDVRRLGNIELIYSQADVWDMVQKTEITGSNQDVLEEHQNSELVDIFLNLLEKVLEFNPKKMIVIMENIDHLLTKQEYKRTISRLCEIGMKYHIYFVLTISLNGYAVCNEEFCDGITIYNEAEFQMPEFYHIVNFINENYPYHRQMSEENIVRALEKIVQKIGADIYLEEVDESVVCKLINRTLEVKDQWFNTPKTPEISFLLN